MKAVHTTKAHLEYIQEVKKLLPKEAFSPDPFKLIYLFGYTVVLVIAYFLFRVTSNIFMYIILSCLVSHALSCIGFLSHELSHNSIIKTKKYRYLYEVFFWGINLIPATIWNRVHNHTHHTQANTPNDPDRQYFTSEKTTVTKWYTKVFYPNRKFIRWNPMVAFHFIPYIFRNIVSVFYSRNSKPVVVPFKPKYSNKQKLKIIAELVIIAMLQASIFYAVDKNLPAYFFASPVSYLLTSSILMSYIFTNHFLNPVTNNNDPLLGTTTVQVPNILNELHFNFAYHTEHHLFPSMNSKFYPVVSAILKEKYPDRYNYLPIAAAWKKLWKNEDFISFNIYIVRDDITEIPGAEETGS